MLLYPSCCSRLINTHSRSHGNFFFSCATGRTHVNNLTSDDPDPRWLQHLILRQIYNKKFSLFVCHCVTFASKFVKMLIRPKTIFFSKDEIWVTKQSEFDAYFEFGWKRKNKRKKLQTKKGQKNVVFDL